MSADCSRPPIVKKGHHKSPTMDFGKKNRLLDIGELDISVIECSDDKEYIPSANNMLNLTDDNISRSFNIQKNFEKSLT